MATRKFASDYEHNSDGLVLFPPDRNLRALLFPFTDPTLHVAKANMLMVKALVEFVSDEGETILDPFAGTGTIMVALTLNRKVVMIELEEHFVKTIESNVIGISNTVPNAVDHTLLIPGDAFIILPLTDFCDHMIFSPPYPQGLKKKGSMDKTSQDLGYAAGTLYSSNPNNLTNYNTFMYHQKIEQFYKKCLLTVRADGTMTVIIKDKIEGGVRQRQADRTIRDCEKIGWTLYAHNKWYARGGGYSEVNRAHGLETVDEESLITFIKLRGGTWKE